MQADLEAKEYVNFKKLGIIKRLQMPLWELCRYYSDLRDYELKSGIPLKGIGLRRLFHPILLLFVRLDRILSGRKLVILNDARKTKSDKPVIYACTHVGYNDVETVFEAIKQAAYLFLGNPKTFYKSPTYLLLWANGVLCLELEDKTDRHNAKTRSCELLKKGGSLLIFPEGSWNLLPNAPVMKLFPGVVQMAAECGADIVPVAIDFEDNRYWVNIGDYTDCSGWRPEDRNEHNTQLRDTLATLMWDIWEYRGIFRRDSIDMNEAEFVGIRMKQPDDGSGLTLEEWETTRYRDDYKPGCGETF